MGEYWKWSLYPWNLRTKHSKEFPPPLQRYAPGILMLLTLITSRLCLNPKPFLPCTYPLLQHSSFCRPSILSSETDVNLLGLAFRWEESARDPFQMSLCFLAKHATLRSPRKPKPCLLCCSFMFDLIALHLLHWSRVRANCPWVSYKPVKDSHLLEAQVL